MPVYLSAFDRDEIFSNPYDNFDAAVKRLAECAEDTVENVLAVLDETPLGIYFTSSLGWFITSTPFLPLIPMDREYCIRCQMVSGGEEAVHLGHAELHEFEVIVHAEDEDEAMEKGHDAVCMWADEHHLTQTRYLMNLADRFTGAQPFTIENFEAEYPEPSMEGATRCPLTANPNEASHPLHIAVKKFMAERGHETTGEPIRCGLWRWEQAPAKFETSKCPGCGYWITSDWRDEP